MPFLSRNSVQEFWTWFQGVAPALAEGFEDQELTGELDTRVAELGDVVWELGPGRREPNALTLSPDGDAELLVLTKEIVQDAPRISGWEFYWARQPRPGQFEFSFGAGDGSHVEIDARPWRYVLYRFPDGVFDIVLEENNLGSLDDDERYAAAVVFLDSVIGEATRIARINEVEPVVKLTKEQAAKANSVKVLARQFESFLDA